MVETDVVKSHAEARPSHVPENLVMDFDLYDVPLRDDDLALSWRDLKAKAPGSAFWSDRNAGHWTVLNGRDVETVYMTPDTFSSIDIFIPPNGSRDNVLIPLEMDPPESLKYRKIIQSQLMPGAIGELVERARRQSVELIEKMVTQGSCDFISDFAGVLPIVVFLALVDLPAEDRDFLVVLAEMSTRPAYPEQRMEGHLALREYLKQNIELRIANPGSDLLSRMALADVDGERMTMDEVLRFATTVMLGGLDTVTNLLGFTALHLARNPEARRELINNPDLINAAADEYARRFGLVSLARRVVADVELGGAQMKAGDMVLAPTWMYALDDDIVQNSLMVDFHRKSAKNLTFGGGAHLCLGMHLAKRELRIFLEEWLRRIPDFEVQPEVDLKIATGLVSGLLNLPLTWDVRG